MTAPTQIRATCPACGRDTAVMHGVLARHKAQGNECLGSGWRPLGAALRPVSRPQPAPRIRPGERRKLGEGVVTAIQQVGQRVYYQRGTATSWMGVHAWRKLAVAALLAAVLSGCGGSHSDTQRRGRRTGMADSNICPKCAVILVKGHAIAQTYSGAPEWKDAEAVTMSVGGPGKLIDCLKCPQCGYSVTTGEAIAAIGEKK